MVTLTALNNLRCSLRPELIATVVAGAHTTVLLTNGVSLEVRESADEVQRQLDGRRAGRATVGAGRSGHGRAH
jgi:uncharacterized protein YlzI (FlbEa/FlbD family)